MFLFDTDVVSQILKTSPLPSLMGRLAAIPPEHQFTSAITVGELVYGAYRSPRRELLLQQLAARVWPNIRVLPFNRASAEVFGRLRARLEQDGTPLAEPDLRIASVALAHDLTMVTGNVRHFGRIAELRIVNWLAE